MRVNVHTRPRVAGFLATTATLVLAASVLLPAATAADSYPPSDTQTLGSAQPRFAGYRVQDIRDWSPQSDPFAQDLRAEVPLQSRVSAPAMTQVKPSLDGKAEVMLMQGDYGNSFFNTPTYNNDYTDNTLNFWQYTDYFSPWHGAATASTPDSLYDPATSDWRNRGFEFGIVNIPNPAYTNAAHRNGVKSIATIYFDPAFRPGLTFAEMFERDPQSQGYIIADKLIEMARYYGFDGYFLNQEEPGTDPSEFKPFMAYLTSQGLWTQWYDTNSTFDAAKRSWLVDDAHGQIHNSVFVNYGWPSYLGSPADPIAYAQATGTDPYTQTFFGVEANQAKFSGSHESARAIPRLYDPATGSPRAALALFTPSDYYQRGLDDDVKVSGYSRPLMQTPDFQWMIHDRERMYFSGVKQDVTATGMTAGYSRPDVGVSDASGWVGVADFTPARSVIGGTRFFSTFNTGHGMGRWTNGVSTSSEQWGNINEQSILPSWQWWITGADGATAQPTLTADFDYGSAEVRRDTSGATTAPPFTPVGGYDGGSSLVIHGDLQDKATIRLFRTDLQVTAATTVEVVARTVAGTPTLSLGVVNKTGSGAVEPIALTPTGTDAQGWTTYTASLADRAGSTVSTLALILEGQGSTQLNVGRLSFTDGSPAPASPDNGAVEHVYADGQAEFTWDAAPFNDVDYYELSARDADGHVTALGATYASRFYVKKLDLSGGPVNVDIVAVGKDGQRSAPTTVPIDPPHGVRALTATPVSAESGTDPASEDLTVAFGGVEGANGYRAVLSLVSTGCEPGALTWTRTLTGSELSTADDGRTQATLTVPFLEGRDYDLTLIPLTDGTDMPGAQPISVRGRLDDRWAEPLPAADASVTGSRLLLHSPTPRDWHVITVTTPAGDTVFTATRGTGGFGVDAPNKHLHEPIDVSKALTDGAGTLEIRLTDYAGNVSQPTTLTIAGGELTDVHVPDTVREQTCEPASIVDPEDPQPAPSPSPTASPSVAPTAPATTAPTQPGQPASPSASPSPSKKPGKPSRSLLVVTGATLSLGVLAVGLLGGGAALTRRRERRGEV